MVATGFCQVHNRKKYKKKLNSLNDKCATPPLELIRRPNGDNPGGRFSSGGGAAAADGSMLHDDVRDSSDDCECVPVTFS